MGTGASSVGARAEGVHVAFSALVRDLDGEREPSVEREPPDLVVVHVSMTSALVPGFITRFAKSPRRERVSGSLAGGLATASG